MVGAETTELVYRARRPRPGGCQRKRAESAIGVPVSVEGSAAAFTLRSRGPRARCALPARQARQLLKITHMDQLRLIQDDLIPILSPLAGTTPAVRKALPGSGVCREGRAGSIARL
jgi:hypothetical protein